MRTMKRFLALTLVATPLACGGAESSSEVYPVNERIATASLPKRRPITMRWFSLRKLVLLPMMSPGKCFENRERQERGPPALHSTRHPSPSQRTTGKGFYRRASAA